jgi:hypothetical protein
MPKALRLAHDAGLPSQSVGSNRVRIPISMSMSTEAKWPLHTLLTVTAMTLYYRLRESNRTHSQQQSSYSSKKAPNSRGARSVWIGRLTG